MHNYFFYKHFNHNKYNNIFLFLFFGDTYTEVMTKFVYIFNCSECAFGLNLICDIIKIV